MMALYSFEDKVTLGLAAFSSLVGATLAWQRRSLQTQGERLSQCEEVTVDELMSSSSSSMTKSDSNVTGLRKERKPVAVRGEVICLQNNSPADTAGIESLTGEKMALRRRMRREITHRLRGVWTTAGMIWTPVTDIQLKTDTVDEVPKWGLMSGENTFSRKSIRVRRGDTEEYIKGRFPHAPASASTEPSALQKGGKELEQIRPTSVITGLLWSMRGILSKMLETIDEGIPIGLSVTVIGGIGKDRDGPFLQAHPTVGFFVVDDFRTLVEYFMSKSQSKKVWSNRFVTAAAGLLGYHVYRHRQYYLQYLRYVFGNAINAPSSVDWLLERLAPNSSRNITLQPSDDETAQTEEEECVICKTNKCKIFCIPCGHLCVCNTCALMLLDTSTGRQTAGKCPMCRSVFQGLNKVYA